MLTLTVPERAELLNDIASRQYTGGQLARMYETTIPELKEFITKNKSILDGLVSKETEQTPSDTFSEPTPKELDDLWISKKVDRLNKLQRVADVLYQDIIFGNGDATNLREFRSYLMAAANELGQLMHRGSGDAGSGEMLSLEISNVDMDAMK